MFVEENFRNRGSLLFVYIYLTQQSTICTCIHTYTCLYVRVFVYMQLKRIRVCNVYWPKLDFFDIFLHFILRLTALQKAMNNNNVNLMFCLHFATLCRGHIFRMTVFTMMCTCEFRVANYKMLVVIFNRTKFLKNDICKG